MWTNIGYERCLSFINLQLRPKEPGNLPETRVKPAITISRMTGSGGRSVAAKLVDFLQEHVPGHAP